jgi:hypothetical protein
MDAKQIFIGLAQRYNRYVPGDVVTPGRTCDNCVRKQYSYPYTCDDGWDKRRNGTAGDGARCLNWTDRGDAKVD